MWLILTGSFCSTISQKLLYQTYNENYVNYRPGIQENSADTVNVVTKVFFNWNIYTVGERPISSSISPVFQNTSRQNKNISNDPKLLNSGVENNWDVAVVVVMVVTGQTDVSVFFCQ